MILLNVTRKQAVARLNEIHSRMSALNAKHRMSAAENTEWDDLRTEADDLAAHVEALDAETRARMVDGLRTGRLRTEAGTPPAELGGDDQPAGVRAAQLAAMSGEAAPDWSTRAAGAIASMRRGERAVVSGSIDVPSLVAPEVYAKPRPARLTDLLVTRTAVPGNAFEYFQQTVRTNLADVVADNALKPTSTFTMLGVEDRCRVIAHLTEPIPLRLLADHQALVRWLNSELAEGVLDALERDVIRGDGTGEHMTGVLNTGGVTEVAFDTDVLTTLRSALTSLQVLGVQPNAWVLHPTDAQTVDLTRWSTPGGFLVDGYANTNAGSANVFGDNAIQRVVSPSVPQGRAILADWTKLGLFIREGVRIDVDAGGELFTKNQAILRGEARIGAGVLMPPAFAVISLGPVEYTATLTDATGGTFTLTFGGLTTSAIAYNASAATVKAALVALDDGYTASDWAVTGSAGGPYTITTPGGTLTGSGASLTGAGATLEVAAV